MKPDDVIDGRYRIVSLLGEGGMGSVYVVEHVHMHKRFALKVLHAAMEKPELIARFEREAMAAGHIDHPNVATATDFGRTADGGFFMVMEYIEGASLRAAINEGALAEARAIAIARQIASALGKAHELGIVHRDLKPENVMLASGDKVKVLDFGIAKVQMEQITGNPGEILTQMGTVFGTPEYMSPEQAQGLAVDHRADLYALGVMMHEMLSGARPFDADDHVQILMQHVTQPPPPLPGHVSHATAALVARLLEKNPEARPASAREVASALEPLATAKTQLPEAAPPSLRALQAMPPSVRRLVSTIPPRARRIAQRIPRPAWIGIGAAVVILPIVIIVLASSHKTVASVPPPPTESVAPKIENAVSDADLSHAREAGSAALSQLWARFPQDSRVGRATAAAYASEHRWADACSAIVRLAAYDPSAARDPEIQDRKSTRLNSSHRL